MNNLIIHFTDLADLLAELPRPAGGIWTPVLRINILDTTYDRVTSVNIRLAEIAVHVRTISPQGHILSCSIRLHRMQIVGSLRDNQQQYQNYLDAWRKAEALLARISHHLTAQGFTVRPGVIDLGDVLPLPGHWNDPADSDDNGELSEP